MHEKPSVALAPCPAYDWARILKALEGALEPFGGAKGIVPHGARVLVKINLLNDTPPEMAVVTHPAVTKAVLRLLKSAGADPIVGEQSGPVAKHVTLRALKVSGTQDVCEEEGVEAVPFQKRGFSEVRCPENRHLKTLHLANEVLAADRVIGIAKLKTHLQALFTGAVKNYFGCMPLKYRKAAHHLGRYRPFCESLVDIYQAVRPSFTFLDGIVGMEGRGPNSGNPRPLGLLLAARDHVACDAVAMDLIGLDPKAYPVLRDAQERGLGEGRLARIRIHGGPPERFRTRFEPPPRFLLNPPPALARTLTWMLSKKPRVDPSLCKGCGFCAESCPADAIQLRPQALIDPKRCIECLCCMELCPHDAVYEKDATLARALRKTKDYVMDRV